MKLKNKTTIIQLSQIQNINTVLISVHSQHETISNSV